MPSAVVAVAECPTSQCSWRIFTSKFIIVPIARMEGNGNWMVAKKGPCFFEPKMVAGSKIICQL